MRLSHIGLHQMNDARGKGCLKLLAIKSNSIVYEIEQLRAEEETLSDTFDRFLSNSSN